MSKIAEWLIAILASILLGYLLVDRAGLPVYSAVMIGMGLIVLGMVVGKGRDKK
jgi:hypothetical protein